ncbi:MAG: hypothetical protein P1P90_03700 [Patescibacteria group bacterium]|nr:hypothetical protein [Patescibacteria group bacterium]
MAEIDKSSESHSAKGYEGHGQGSDNNQVSKKSPNYSAIFWLFGYWRLVIN